MKVFHTLEPFYDENSKILILGSIPSVKSRELNFYYAHPQNRFWKVLAAVFEEPYPITKEEKTNFLIKHHIALWDVIASCDITGSSDSSIKNVKINNIKNLIEKTQITHIFTTGKKAYNLYQKYCFEKTKIKAFPLPSTSAANIANFNFEQLQNAYKILKL